MADFDERFPLQTSQLGESVVEFRAADIPPMELGVVIVEETPEGKLRVSLLDKEGHVIHRITHPKLGAGDRLILNMPKAASNG